MVEKKDSVEIPTQSLFSERNSESVRVGLCSRIDYGGPQFRQGLVNLGAETFQKELVHFIIVAGGIVSYAGLQERVKDKGSREAALDEIAEELKEVFPRVYKAEGILAKWYIITSRSQNYDGWIGEQVAHRLVRLREDIRYFGDGSAILPVKQVDKSIWVLTPQKASWRSKYYSTPVDRLIEDKQKQSPQGLADLYVVGCFGSAMDKPSGEKPRPYLSIPVLHRLEGINTSENQIGVRIVEFPYRESPHFVRTHSFQDIVSKERGQIRIPPSATKNERKIIEALKELGVPTVGVFSEKTGIKRETVERVIKAINGKGYKPAIILDVDSNRYDFDSEWIEKELRYKVSGADFKEDRIAAFACLHAGYRTTGYRFFVKRLPEFLFANRINVLFGVGDFIAGLRHNMMLRGEIYGGFNSTIQEKLAAYLIGFSLLNVFKRRLDELLSQRKSERLPTNGELLEMIHKALIQFCYIPGNHDLWLQDEGVTPLEVFRSELVRFLVRAIERILRDKQIRILGVIDLVESKIVESQTYTLPSGLSVEMTHPHMARAQTTSLRAQATLAKSKCPIVISGNFHVAVHLNEWNPGTGQRIALQVGTLVTGTDFEDNKLKVVDFGIGFLRVLSRNGRIYMTENAFLGDAEKEEELDNSRILTKLLDDLGIDIK